MSKSPFYKTGVSKSPLFHNGKPGHKHKPSHGETYGDFHKRTSGGATNHWGGPETDKKLLNSQYSDSSSTFVRNPKHLNLNPAKLKEAKDILKNAKENRRKHRKAKPYKKFESRTEDGKPKWYKEGNEWVESGQYENRSEFKSSMAEENSLVDDARQDLKKARKQYRKNKNT